MQKSNHSKSSLPIAEDSAIFTALLIEFGGMSGAAKALGISYQAIHNWKKRGIPLGKIRMIEQLSKNRVNRKML